MSANKWTEIAIGTVGFGLIFNYLWTDRRVKAMVAPKPLEQDDWFPTGRKSPVGCHAGTPSRGYPVTALLGGTSVVTSSTGRWAA